MSGPRDDYKHSPQRSLSSDRLPDLSAELDEEENVRDLSKLEVDVREDPFSIFDLVRKIDSKLLNRTPDFQRNEVWTPTQKSRFIESVLLHYPLPPLYLNQLKDGTYLVVDGLQRTSSVYRFIKNEYPLQELETLYWLNGKKFDQLEPQVQARIHDRKMNCYVLKPSVEIGTVHEIFRRINTGGTQLNYQELRNALYHGPATELLKDMARDKNFSDLIGSRLGANRMGDQEAVLRCISFARIDPEVQYKSRIDRFLDNTLRDLSSNHPKAVEERASIANDFPRAMRLAIDIWGPHAFELPILPGNAKHLSLAVMESIYRVLVKKADSIGRANRAKLNAALKHLQCDSRYREATFQSPSDQISVKTRFQLARQMLDVNHV